MKLELGPEIISSYKRLAYKPWYALAEFVDNSTQAYFNNRSELDAVFAAEKTILTVEISSETDESGAYFIKIADNSIGMSQAELENAVYVGKPPHDPRGRSRYGLGLKTGACWFGDFWTIESKKLNEPSKHLIIFDVPAIAGGVLELPHTPSEAPAGEHGTTIIIKKLHRHLTGRTLGKVKTYLRSLYRRDISNGLLILKVNGEKLEWDADIDSKLVRRHDGSLAKKDLRFRVGDKVVTGWAGVLEKGSRANAGFSLIQSNRVITGWPNSYRPETVFGEQEGGVNDLVNQRLFGELVLEKFDVSHTKDEILFEDGEQERLEAELQKELADLRQLAATPRKNADERITKADDKQRALALNAIEDEIRSAKMQTFFQTFEVPANSLTIKTNRAVKNAVVKRAEPNINAMLGEMTVKVYLSKDMSPNDPYVIIEPDNARKTVIVIVNVSHPYWAELSTDDAVADYIRQCVYDGVAESKAYFVTGKIEPDTVKLIKDNLLRVPIDI
jgi:hypothetical protein